MGPESGQQQGTTTISNAELTLSDGYSITYTIVGDECKPLLLFIAGTSGLGILFRRLSIELTSHFRCLYFNRRGYVTTDAAAAKAKNGVVSVQQHADDVAALIQHISPSTPVFIFGTSAGGLSALDLTMRYPQLVHTAILHEPMTLSTIEDEALRNDMISLHRRVGLMSDPTEGFAIASHRMFRPTSGTESSNPFPSVRTEIPATWWTKSPSSPSPMEVFNARQGMCEALSMAQYVVDERELWKSDRKLVLGHGEESRHMPVIKLVQGLAKLLGDGKCLWEFPGGHMNFVTKQHVAAFCEKLLDILYQEGKMPQLAMERQAKM